MQGCHVIHGELEMDIFNLRCMLRHPEIFLNQVDQFIKSRIHLKWYYWIGQKFCSTMPHIVSMRLNSPEAPEPLICGQFGSFGVTSTAARKHATAVCLPSSTFRRIIDDIAGIRAQLIIWGRDPFFYPGFSDILDQISMRNIFCRIGTRGTLLEKYADALVRLGINDVIVSLDGPAQVYKNLNPRSTDFEAISEGIKKLVALKKEIKSRKPLLRGAVMISPENYHYLDEIVAWAEEIGLESMTINYTFFVTDSMGQSHHRFFLDTFNCSADSWDRFKMDVSGIEASALIRDILRVQRRPNKIPLCFFPPLKTWQIADFYKSPDFSAGADRCKIPWFMMNVLESGKVVPCVDYPDYVVGDLTEDAIFPCWNNEDMLTFRNELIRYGKFPICSRCSGLYGL